MEIKLQLTEEQALDLLAQLERYRRKAKVTLDDAEYERLYWSGQSALSLSKQYGVNHNHFIRVWKRIGLDTILLPSQRPARKARLDAMEQDSNRR